MFIFKISFFQNQPNRNMFGTRYPYSLTQNILQLTQLEYAK